MTRRLRPLDAVKHRPHGWTPPRGFRHAAADPYAPLSLAELAAALPYYPLAFADHGSDGPYLVAVQSLYADSNLFVAPDGRWLVAYIPCHYRGWPFALRELVVNGERAELLCFDESSGLYRETPEAAAGDEPFFDASGRPTERVQRVMAFLRAAGDDRRATDRAVAALAEAGLLVPWRSEPGAAGDAPPLSGISRIDPAALNGLDGAALARLRDSGALTLAYAQLLSASRIAVLRALDAYRHRDAARRAAPVVDLSGADDGGLRFVWDAEADTKGPAELP